MMKALHLSSLKIHPSLLQVLVMSLSPPAVYFILLGTRHQALSFPYPNPLFLPLSVSFILDDAQEATKEEVKRSRSPTPFLSYQALRESLRLQLN